MDNPIISSELNQAEKPLGNGYLRFQLEPKQAAILSMDYIQEVLVVPVERLTPIPNMPAEVLGLLNRRNLVLWVIDLGQLLNLQPSVTNPQQYSIVIIKVGQVPLGLMVQEVKGVTKFMLDQIESAIEFVTSDLLSYLDGCIVQETETLLVLSAEKIVNSPRLHSNYN